MKRILRTICHLFDPVPPGGTVLANELGGMVEHGRETLQIDPATPLPVGSHYLIYKRGSNQYYATICDATSLPLGVSPDAPYQIGDFLDVERFGAQRRNATGLQRRDDCVRPPGRNRVRRASAGCDVRAQRNLLGDRTRHQGSNGGGTGNHIHNGAALPSDCSGRGVELRHTAVKTNTQVRF